ncbi:MAG: M48 family metalloprotease, partial [Pseudomonadota bacterium]
INDLTSLSFSRSAEREADAAAIAMLDDADISPAPTAAFFRELQADEEDMMGDMATMASFVSTHPASEGRADRFAAAVDEDRDYAPAMTAAEWETVQALCK